MLSRLTTPTLLHRGKSSRIERILICTAVGEPGKSDVRVGGWLARRLGARVLLLHVSPIGRPPAGWVTRHLEAGLATLRSLDVDADLSIQEAGDATAGILAAAHRENVDLIVIGGHGPSSARLLRPDDVTLRIVRGSDRPVLIVPEPD
jgi:nucleotide-binding universal stress UspA family protein